MNWTHILSLGFLAYLLGSIPTAIWIGKWFYKKDIRDLGSGNAGFSNALRVFGPKAGIPVLIVDVGKGFAAVSLSNMLNIDNQSFAGQLIPVIYGLLAFLGHLIPIFAGFKGGKGVATGLGIILALFPLGALYRLAVYILAILLFRMMSVGSMLACISLPISVYLEMKFENPVLMVFTIFITLMIIFTHRTNIRRIISGTENRIWFRKKPKETK